MLKNEMDEYKGVFASLRSFCKKCSFLAFFHLSTPPKKQERAEIEELQHTISKLRTDHTARESTWRMTMDKVKATNIQLQERSPSHFYHLSFSFHFSPFFVSSFLSQPYANYDSFVPLLFLAHIPSKSRYVCKK